MAGSLRLTKIPLVSVIGARQRVLNVSTMGSQNEKALEIGLFHFGIERA
jgi:hypothetical protein